MSKYIMDNNQDVLGALVQLWDNLRKLPKVKRTSENVLSPLNRAKQQWELFKANHEKLCAAVRVDNPARKPVDDLYETGQTIFRKIQAFVRKIDVSLVDDSELLPGTVEETPDEFDGTDEETVPATLTTTPMTTTFSTTTVTTTFASVLPTFTTAFGQVTPATGIFNAPVVQTGTTPKQPIHSAVGGFQPSSTINTLAVPGTSAQPYQPLNFAAFDQKFANPQGLQNVVASTTSFVSPSNLGNAWPTYPVDPLSGITGNPNDFHANFNPNLGVGAGAPVYPAGQVYGFPPAVSQYGPSFNSYGDAIAALLARQIKTDEDRLKLEAMKYDADERRAAEKAEEKKYKYRNEDDKTIPMFDGHYRSNYIGFREIFHAVTDHSPLSKTQKFNLARSKLTGIALKLVASISCKETNYERLWETLDDEFDNQMKTFFALMRAIKNFPKTKPNNRESLSNFLTEFSNAATNIEGLGIHCCEFMSMEIIERMDATTYQRCVDYLNPGKTIPTVDDLITFFKKEVQGKRDEEVMPEIQFSQAKDSRGNRSSRNNNNTHVTNTHVCSDWENFKLNSRENEAAATTQRKKECLICSGEHFTSECAELLSAPNKIKLLKNKYVCIICLRHKYSRRFKCRSVDSIKCTKCGKPGHLALICEETLQSSLTHLCIDDNQTLVCHNTTDSSSVPEPLKRVEIVLPTAIASIVAANQTLFPVRCLVDQCSQSSYIAADFVQQLKLNKTRIPDVRISGLNGEIGEVAKFGVKLQIRLKDGSNIDFHALIVPAITGDLPPVPKEVTWTTQGLELADPEFATRAQITILLGSNILPFIILDGTVRQRGLLLQNTKLGWIVSGIPDAGSSNYHEIDIENIGKYTSTHVTLTEFEESLFNFWDLPITREEGQEMDDEYCERMFVEKHRRLDDGRYALPIPWKENAPKLGNSYRRALYFFLAQERRWHLNSVHLKLSNEFMQEYLDMNHMELVPIEDQKEETGRVFYMPYISVFRETAVTSKIRNVFNGSAMAQNGISLNQTIHAGPKLQNKIFNVITRVRQFQYVYSADIKMMFRQFALIEEDRDRMRILWRAKKEDPIQEYRLTCVTYGTDAAPFMALRGLRQCAIDNAPNEKIKRHIFNAFYVDDILNGGDTIEECQEDIDDLTSTLNAGQLPLTKWMSNHPSILARVPAEKRLDAYIELDDHDPTVKTLGILFRPNEDAFSFRIKAPEKLVFTRRGMLSAVAGLFDPVGWLIPVVVRLRILLQQLWLEPKATWDSPISEEIKQKFLESFDSLSRLEELRISRWLLTKQDSVLELVGFSDASADAFAAVIYSRVQTTNGYDITLLASRARVTPLKSKKNKETGLTSTPKMELESVLLLTELFTEVASSFEEREVKLTAYTDSQIVLCWVRNQKNLENRFAKRRVVKILKVIKPADIHYVRSAENPSDCASRGLTPENLLNHVLWLEGPAWLKDVDLPRTPFDDLSEPDDNITNESHVLATFSSKIKEPKSLTNFIEHFSRYTTLVRAVAKVLRWKPKPKPGEQRGHKFSDPVTAAEITNAKTKILHYQQKISFGFEIKKLESGKPLSKHHWMSTLNPYIDPTSRLIRVGGRLGKGKLEMDFKHPVLLPKKSHLNVLIIREFHETYGHCGNGMTERLVRESLWIPSCRTRVKKVIRQCTTCIRWRGMTKNQVMADLPARRIEPAPVFSQVGLDYAGPYLVRGSKLKFDREIKVYVVVFVCLAVKAVHLEVVQDLTAEAFLACFMRFTSRRGVPTYCLSDNGSQLKAASKIIELGWDKCFEKFAYQEITWEFTPVRAPSFGGIYESAVKSFKYYEKRFKEPSSKLTAEEFNSLVIRVEGYLNVRPLYPDTSDPSEPAALTAFHFIAQRSMKLNPGDIVQPAKNAITRRWRQVHEVQDEMWEILRTEYLKLLQKRYKWKTQERNLEVGDVVLLKETDVPPNAWPLAIVTKQLPDEDGNVRQVEIKTAVKSGMRRASSHLVPLLPEDEDDVDEIPKLRRSARIKQLNLPSPTTIVSNVLMCWLMIINPAMASMIHTLNPGTSVEKIGRAQIKISDFTYTLTTNQNVTDDMMCINKQISEFKGTCEDFDVFKDKDLHNHCLEQLTTLRQEMKTLTTEFEIHYSNRLKRSVGSVVKAAVPYISVALTTGAVVYQAVEMSNVESKLARIEEKLELVSRISMKRTDLKFEAVGNSIGSLRRFEQDVAAHVKITEQMAAVRGLMNKIRIKHESLWNFSPNEELQKHIQQHPDLVAPAILPRADEGNVIKFRPTRKTIADGLVELHYLIPLIYNAQFTEYALISIGDDEGLQTNLPNGKSFDRIALDEANSTFFTPASRYCDDPLIYENIKLDKPNECLTNLIQNNQLAAKTTCGTLKLNVSTLTIFSPRENYTVVLQPFNATFLITCNNTTQIINSTSTAISEKDCKIRTKHHTFFTSHLKRSFYATENDAEIGFKPFEATFHPVTINPEIDLATLELLNAINTKVVTEGWSWVSSPFTYIAVISMLLIAIIVLIRCKIKRSNKRSDDIPMRNFAAEFVQALGAGGAT